MTSRWNFWIDVGGTFTDCIGVDPTGQKHFAKVLSSGGAYPAPIAGIRRILELEETSRLPAIDVRLGTTRGTNALLTRTGARVALVTSIGFGDLLRIGYQNRPELFAVDIRKPEPLFEKTIEARERILADGSVATALDQDHILDGLSQLRSEGIESLAICLMHAFRFPQHETKIEKLARQAGFEEVSVSHQVAPEIRIIPRAYTTVLDAYLNPILRQYIAEIRSHLAPESKLNLFSSSGALIPAERFTGKDSILSGPAGGVVGFSQTAARAGFEQTIGFDMGGTSTDVSRFDGKYHYQYESEKSGVFIVAPTLSIETVAAGGGSVCHLDGARMLVGPQSAGADPGPACYGKGGPLCLTDVNLYLGRIFENEFPFPLDLQAVENRLQQIQSDLEISMGSNHTLEWIANGFLEIAIAKTAEAIRLVSVQKGYNVSKFTLVSFGGAGGQIACRVAEALGIQRVLSHPHASLLSAYGIGLANQVVHKSSGLYKRLANANVPAVVERLQDELETEWNSSDFESRRLSTHFRSRVDVRYLGTESWLTIDYRSAELIPRQFEEMHQQLFGFTQSHELEIGAIRVEMHLGSNEYSFSSEAWKRAEEQLPDSISSPEEIRSQSARPFPVIGRGSISDQPTAGPLLVHDRFTNTIVEKGWEATRTPDGQLLLTFQDPSHRDSADSEVDLVQVELFNNQMFSIAEQMGETLKATAVSVNVKERLDFSCAVFSATGDLMANAPHIPIHLGAMSECVKGIIEDNETITPGDVFVTNDPYRGGSHLPDITVVTPCFDPKNRLKFWVASRAHHAEIGGMVPGSMPPNSRTLDEEGVLIRNFRLIQNGQPRLAELERLLKNATYPSRKPEDNLSDIQAQVAANHKGVQELDQVIDRLPSSMIDELIQQVQELAESETRRGIRELPNQALRFEDRLDCGAIICVQIQRQGDDCLLIDFGGSSPTLENNLNANRAIVLSAVIYVFRMLIGKDIPLNQGILNPITVRLPECFLNPRPGTTPAQSPAVVGGNVETSQRIVDVLMGALGIAAASQGTTNNVIFGDERFGYYETICGGSGASENSAGADAVQVHITNTRITDPEILETRYPVILEEFSIRKGSGGRGKNRGGDGVIRRMQFTRPLTLSVLCNRYQDSSPFGIKGGEPGKRGELEMHRDETGTSAPEASDQTLRRGFEIRTPGGGGWGEPA